MENVFIAALKRPLICPCGIHAGKKGVERRMPVPQGRLVPTYLLCSPAPRAAHGMFPGRGWPPRRLCGNAFGWWQRAASPASRSSSFRLLAWLQKLQNKAGAMWGIYLKTRETARRGVDARPVIQPLANGITSGTAKSSLPMPRSLQGFG